MIDPAAPALRRVIGIKRNALLIFTAKDGLNNIPDLFHAGKLINFLKPGIFDIAAAQVDGLHLPGVISGLENYLLPGDGVYDLHRGDLEFKKMDYPHLCSSPLKLAKYGITKLVLIATENHSVCVRFLYEAK